jgi:hypothetical protein
LDFALIGSLEAEPASIDEALRGSDAKEWEEALWNIRPYLLMKS